LNAQDAEEVSQILASYDPQAPRPTADRLRDLWLQFEPKSIDVIRASQRMQQETVGIAVPVLRTIGQEISKPARNEVQVYLPLACLLWEEYGREGRVIAVHPLGAMELAEPDIVLPLLQELCRTCITWEDADQLAMYALEPIVRKDPDQWLIALEPWLADDSKWLRRAGVTVAGRLAMKQPVYTTRCLALAESLLLDEEMDVRRAVSFAIRLCARGAVGPVRDFLRRHVPPEDPRASWVLCDAIRSMANKLLPQFAALLPDYEQWLEDPALGPQDRRSVESAVKVLRRLAP
jgi:3-methyladenine DNA glycosylase AlkD